MNALSLMLATICLNNSCTNENPVNYIIRNGGDFSEDALGDSTDIDDMNEINLAKQNLNGKHMYVATLEDFPLSYTEIINGTVIGKGVSFELLKLLAKKLNFTYEVILPQNNILGSVTDIKGSLLDLMNTSEIDLAATFIPYLQESKNFIEYSSVTLDEGEWIMVMKRPEESATGSGLLAPFEKWVWILILISLLLVGPIIYLLIIIRNKLTGNNYQKPYSIGHCAWFVYGALMKQGSTLSPIADSTRLLFATWWIFITILTSFYTANLTAFLTLSKVTLPVNTMDDIVKKERSFVTLRGGGVEYAIKNTDEPLSDLSKMLTKNLAIFQEEMNDTELLTEFVEKKNYIFIRDKPAILHALYLDYCYRRGLNIEDEKIHCPFATSKGPILKKNRSFAYPKESTLKKIFDQELLNLVESGIVKHLLQNELPSAEICPQDLGGTERQLRNGDLMMTYYIMLAGFATGSVVFITELFFRYLNERREKKLSANIYLGKFHHKHNTIIHSSFPYSITPPPSYGSIFKTNTNVIMNMNKLNRRNHHQIENPEGIKKFINGRNYLVFKGPNGEKRLIPIRAPSATLFQYTYTK